MAQFRTLKQIMHLVNLAVCLSKLSAVRYTLTGLVFQSKTCPNFEMDINCHVEGSVTEQFAVPSKSIYIASMMEYVDVN